MPLELDDKDKRIFLDEDLKVFFSDDPEIKIMTRMDAKAIKQKVRKGFIIKILKRGGR